MNEGMDNDSPRLEPVQVNLGPRPPTPPPFVHQDNSPKEKHAVKATRNGRVDLTVGQREANSHFLQQTLAFNNPELWRVERENTPIKLSPPGCSYRQAPPFKPPARPLKLLTPGFTEAPQQQQHPNPDKGPLQADLKDQAQDALHLLNRPAASPPAQVPSKTRLPPLSTFDKPDEAVPPPAKFPKLERSSSSLSEFIISAPGSQNALAPLCNPSSKAPSPEDSTRLPPIAELKSALPSPNGHSARTPAAPYSLPPVAASPPAGVAHSPRESHHLAPLVRPPYQPSPYPYLSPASTQAMSAVSSPVSQQSYRHPKPPVYPYDPPSANSHRSPASSYPTPIDRPVGAFEPAYTPTSQSSASGVIGAFQCAHPGCTAPPFQTQYLLNSHANVHSQDRPHFCPVEGCSRGPGGKGFKRKNEMIRHGLVHNSPGYVCPFCPDQQHKYPRPDNLQRHVRVHHVDKNKDDPALRHVLSQRPEGSGRGRRRRINPQ
ncbi:hypothetical protein BDV18DRAFT_163662 [Aspergillus unguis]